MAKPFLTSNAITRQVLPDDACVAVTSQEYSILALFKIEITKSIFVRDWLPRIFQTDLELVAPYKHGDQGCKESHIHTPYPE